MKGLGTPLTLILLLLCTTLAPAGDFWRSKDFHQWSERECQSLLTKSPWAAKKKVSAPGKQVTTVTEHSRPPDAPSRYEGMIQNAEAHGGITGGEGTPAIRIQREQVEITTVEFDEAPYVEYLAQIRSALPIRQALVHEIELKSQRLPAEKQQAAEQATSRFLSYTFPDTVVVYITMRTNTAQDVVRSLVEHWRQQKVETLKTSVFLVGGSGEKAPLVDYSYAEDKGAFQMSFPRQTGDRPLLLPGDKSLRLEFDHPALGKKAATHIVIAFDATDMKLGNEVIY